MKIALVYLGKRGGLAMYSLEIAQALKGKAQVFPIVSVQSENIEQWKKNFPNVLKVNTYTNKLEFLLSFFNFKIFFSLYKEIKNFSPDVIYYPGFHFWLPLISIFFPKIPKVYTVHDPILHTGEKNLLTHILQTMLIRQARRVVVLSKIFVEVLVHQGIAANAIDVIPHGIFGEYTRLRLIAKKVHNPTILFFGRIITYKGLPILLKAYSIIKAQIPDVELVIAGDGEIESKKDLMKDPAIKIINRWIPDNEIGTFFAEADLLVCPYIESTQSGVIPIAYQFKIPVVATNVGGFPDQVEHGVTGFIVPPGNEVALAASCIELLKNSELRKTMGENGYKKAHSDWDWSTIARKVLATLKKASEVN